MKKVIAMFLCAALIGTLMVGCSASKDSESDSVTKEGDAEDEATAEDEKQEGTTEEDATEGEVTIKILKAEGSQQEIWDEISEYYTANVKPNVTVEVECSDELDSILMTRINAGEAPDIFTTQPYVGVSKYAEYACDLADSGLAELLPEDILASGTTSDGKLCGLPFYGDAQGIVYNKGMFEQAGIEKVPETLEELAAACEKLQAAGFTPFFNAYGAHWVTFHIVSAFYSAEAANMGGVDALNTAIQSGELKFEDSEYMKNYLKVLNLTTQYGNTDVNVDFQDQYNAFALEQCAMVFQGNWYENSFNKLFDDASEIFEIGLFAPPVSEDDASTAKLLVSPAWNYMISNESEHYDECVEFLRWLIDDSKAQELFFGGITKLPLAGSANSSFQLNTSAKEYMNEGTYYTSAVLQAPTEFNGTVAGEWTQSYLLGEYADDSAALMDLTEIYKGTLAE